jgi:DNA modification methylase
VKESGHGWELTNGDSCEWLQTLAEGSVDLAVFSPPFASLFAYSDDPRDLSNNDTYEQFGEHYGYIAHGLARVMKPGRIVCVHCMVLPTSKTRDGYIGLRDLPGDLIRWHEQAGFIFHSKVTIWKDPVVAMQRTKALGLLHKQLLKDSTMSRMGLPDEVLMFRAPGENAESVTHRRPAMLRREDQDPDFNEGEPFPIAAVQLEKSDGDEVFGVDLWQKWASPVWDDIDQSDVLPCRAAKDEDDQKHLCPLQREVVRRCIRLYSRPGDLVLTPFGGIGTELVVALEEGRRAIGCELKPSYFKQAVANLRATQQTTPSLFGSLNVASGGTNLAPPR